MSYSNARDADIVGQSTNFGFARCFSTPLDGVTIAQQVALGLSAALAVRVAEWLNAVSWAMIGLHVDGAKAVAREVVSA